MVTNTSLPVKPAVVVVFGFGYPKKDMRNSLNLFSKVTLRFLLHSANFLTKARIEFPTILPLTMLKTKGVIYSDESKFSCFLESKLSFQVRVIIPNKKLWTDICGRTFDVQK